MIIFKTLLYFADVKIIDIQQQFVAQEYIQFDIFDQVFAWSLQNSLYPADDGYG